MVRKWNEKVKEDDIVYILGDLSYRSSISVKTYLKQLKGRKHLIVEERNIAFENELGENTIDLDMTLEEFGIHEGSIMKLEIYIHGVT